MKFKKYLFLLPLLSLLVVGCDDDDDILIPGPEGPCLVSYDFVSLLQTLTSTEFAQTGELNVYAGTSLEALQTAKTDIESVWDGDFSI